MPTIYTNISNGKPNFAHAADDLQSLAREVQSCSNIQAVQDASTLNRIELGALRRTMETKLDAIDPRPGTVE
ncbi:hypothetical protein X797_003465 [Metarhizium robertsii]|uniref:Uncharacterized protein n=1 Tax=Metarhizium robertsii TaxID=568076 RepID=A0A0A1V211_9HYPO|nr:hypothetical protein X797_003465 [Metarhizium robertsii]